MLKPHDPIFVRDAFALVRDLKALQVVVNQHSVPSVRCPDRLVRALDGCISRYDELAVRHYNMGAAERYQQADLAIAFAWNL
jgi:hypothetical protein